MMKKIISLNSNTKLNSTENVSEVLKNYISSSQTICLISAFLTKSVLQLFEESDYNKDLSIYVRCRPSDCINKSCDLEVLKHLVSKGVNCYADYKLHAKLYIFDSYQAVIGSSNLTANGLGFSNFPNFELNYICELSDNDLLKVNDYLENCTQISVEDISKMQEELSNIDSTSKSKAQDEWSSVNLFLKKELIGLFIEDFPKCNPFELSDYSDEDILHDEVMFGSNLFDSLKFERSNIFRFIYRFLKTQESHSASFGALTSYIHNHILDDFSPYRSELKIYIQNFISYLSYYKCNSIEVKNQRNRQILNCF